MPFELDHQVIVNTGLKVSPIDPGGEPAGNAAALAYCLDVKRIDEAALRIMEGSDTLVLDMLREKSHPTHMNLAEALATVERVRPRKTYFGHISHEVSHAALETRLPENVQLAYDGLVLSVPY
jgi:phosphoribosyl 1,2-cyclic phosphate phosphodiesterase